ncbi:hypothetical protein X947_5372 [Burkholderia pseudomallei MSHR7334]|nr:hypothetical protein X947_5372 [Burkholderia pseudomallei MSHR7334]
MIGRCCRAYFLPCIPQPLDCTDFRKAIAPRLERHRPLVGRHCRRLAITRFEIEAPSVVARLRGSRSAALTRAVGRRCCGQLDTEAAKQVRDELGQDESIFGVRFARIVVFSDDFERLDCCESVLRGQLCGLLWGCGQIQSVTDRQDNIAYCRDILSKDATADFVLASAFCKGSNLFFRQRSSAALLLVVHGGVLYR